MVFQEVTRNRNIPAAAKGLYAYLSSYCGVDDECYPSIDTITSEMGMTKDTFYKHVNLLVATGVIEKKQVIGNDGKFGRTVYKLLHEVEILNFPFPKNSDTVFSETNNNIIKKENTKRNSMQNACDSVLQNNEELNNNFEIIYKLYPKKVGRTRAFALYKAWVGKGRKVNGINYKLTNRHIYKAVQKYVRNQEKAEIYDYQYWKNFDTLMGNTLLDYVEFEE